MSDLTYEVVETKPGRCDRGNCLGKGTNNYKGHSLCDYHFSHYMAMQQG